MVSKKGHPEIRPTDRIVVEGKDCIISQVCPETSVMGAYEVVTNSDCPVSRDVFWDGEQWTFSKRPSFVDAAKSFRLKPFIELL